MSEVDQFQHWDGAYVLGALSDAERETFEEHLLTCDACTMRVAEVVSLPALLSGLSAEDVAAEPEPLPETLLPRMMRAADAKRRRTRVLVSSLAGLAAVLIAALVVALAWPSSSSNGTTKEVALHGVSGVRLTASVKLVAKDWGTELDVTCRYNDPDRAESPAYALRVFTKDGPPQNIGWWQLKPGHTETFPSTTNLKPDQISRIEITVKDKPVLWANR